MQELLQLIFMVIGVIVVVICVVGVIVTCCWDYEAETVTLTMVKMHYYDALGCKIDAGSVLLRKDDLEQRVQYYIDERFKDNTEIYWEILSVEGE
jgi:hypothetical protein